ncbi:unnamed protein product [Rotaria magnacalcarata]|uniref:F-box domain-containing protein n=2 Tax=Rotaria magnacalcarata TaxID=392030 RepID=A0A819X762_9BILA|nr:unnamed protein product [Rotaria magnacalcarata]
MTLFTCFDDLPDLVLIELFSYLSSIDILWGFTRLNNHLTMLIDERRFFHHANLSLAHYHQFNTILRFLRLNNIESLAIDTNGSSLQLTHWPHLSRLRTLRIATAYDLDDLSIFLLRHAATLTHLIIKSNERLIPDGFTINSEYTIAYIATLIEEILFTRLPALQSLDLGMNNYGTCWPFTTTVVPLTYLRIDLPCIDTLVRFISTPPLCDTLRQLHVHLGNANFAISTFNLSIQMIHLHTFTFAQTFFSELTTKWSIFEMLTSSNVMPVLRRLNMSLFINMNDLNHIGSSPLFTDTRHIDVHFAFNLINCPQYIEMTQYIPRGSRFHPREIIGVTFVVKHWSSRSEWRTNSDPFSRGRRYHHHLWYTLPWAFDEFFHDYLPEKCITKIEVFEQPSQNTTTINQSSLRTLDACGQTLALLIYSLPHVVLSDYIETFHLSYYNRPIRIHLSALHTITLVNSIKCLNKYSFFPPTICSIRILLFYNYPNYKLPNWPVVLDSLSKFPQLNSLHVFMYDLPKTIDDRSCKVIARIAPLFNDFAFCFRYKFGILEGDELEAVFKDHGIFIRQLCHYILSLPFDKKPYYLIETEGYGLKIWL